MLAKKHIIGIALLAMLTAVLLASNCFAADDEEVRVAGVVSVTRNADNVITSVTLTEGETNYNVVLDEKGLELGENMDGQEADVDAFLTEKDGQKWLKVIAILEVEE
jgi:hypothetical protein